MDTIMKENDRWSVHLEYLKVAITLATAMLAAAAAVYSEPAKIPSDDSKYVLLGCAVAVLLTLIASVLAITAVANRVADKTPTGPTTSITIMSGFSFFALVATGILLLIFFTWRTLSGGLTGPQQAIEVAQTLIEKQIAKPSEIVTLVSLEAKAEKFDLLFRIASGPKTVSVVFDPKTRSILSLFVQPPQ